jgi:hypothetical protein
MHENGTLGPREVREDGRSWGVAVGQIAETWLVQGQASSRAMDLFYPSSAARV